MSRSLKNLARRVKQGINKRENVSALPNYYNYHFIQWTQPREEYIPVSVSK